MMNDILRVSIVFTSFHESHIEKLIRVYLQVFNRFKGDKNLSVHMVEVSEVLAQIQADKICSSNERTDSESMYMRGKTKHNVPVHWYKSFFNTHLRGFTLTVAHEFFDALPIHKLQVIYSAEKMIGNNNDNNSQFLKFSGRYFQR